jgi:hypothetical protein
MAKPHSHTQCAALVKRRTQMNQNDLSSMLMDLYDLRRTLPKNVKAMPKDNEGSDFTIGELLDDMIEKLEQAGA